MSNNLVACSINQKSVNSCKRCLIIYEMPNFSVPTSISVGEAKSNHSPPHFDRKSQAFRDLVFPKGLGKLEEADKTPSMQIAGTITHTKSKQTTKSSHGLGSLPQFSVERRNRRSMSSPVLHLRWRSHPSTSLRSFAGPPEEPTFLESAHVFF